MYTLKFFDNDGERDIVIVSNHETVEGALADAYSYGARKFEWDTCIMAGLDRIKFGKVCGTLCIVNDDYVNERFGG